VAVVLGRVPVAVAVAAGVDRHGRPAERGETRSGAPPGVAGLPSAVQEQHDPVGTARGRVPAVRGEPQAAGLEADRLRQGPTVALGLARAHVMLLDTHRPPSSLPPLSSRPPSNRPLGSRPRSSAAGAVYPSAAVPADAAFQAARRGSAVSGGHRRLFPSKPRGITG